MCKPIESGRHSFILQRSTLPSSPEARGDKVLIQRETSFVHRRMRQKRIEGPLYIP